MMSQLSQSIVAGVAAFDYFTPEENRDQFSYSKNPTMSATKRACINSFGSIAASSLVLAITQLLKSLFQSKTDGNRSLSASCTGYLCQIIADIVTYVNQYVNIRIAIYGDSYWNSAKAIITLMKESGANVIASDGITGGVTGMLALFAGGLSILVSYAVTDRSVFDGHDEYISKMNFFSNTIPAFFIGIIVSGVFLNVLQTSTSAMMVCFVDNPSALAETKPKMHSLFIESYPDVVSGAQI